MESPKTSIPRLCLGIAVFLTLGVASHAWGEDATATLEKLTKLFDDTAKVEIKGSITVTPTTPANAEAVAENEKEKYIKKCEKNAGQDYNPFVVQQDAERLKQSLLKGLKDVAPQVFKIDFAQSPQGMVLKYFNVNDPGHIITEYYTGGTIYHIDSVSKTINITKTDETSGYYIGVVSEMWSRPARLSAARASYAGVKISDTPDKRGLIYSANDNGFETAYTISKNNWLLTESDILVPKTDYSQKITYGDFFSADGVTVPKTITFENNNKDDKLKRVFTIDEIKFDPKVDLVPENFGFMQVCDGRFNPALNYFSRDTLPSSDVLVGMAADPNKLTEYNMRMNGNPGNDAPPPANNN
jgi:Domain of unknown function (DUF4292)